ncbi:hypothetical protein Btru_076733 [Bulinus truncatus]|nr:hypothetical protein Btru_076733 [Bulinus truncatus]
MESLQVENKDIKLTHELKRDLMLELKKRHFGSTPSDSIWAFDAGRRPKEILSSSRKGGGDPWKRNSLGRQDRVWTPAPNKSSLLNGQNDRSNGEEILNGNLRNSSSNRRVSSPSTASPPDSPGSQWTNRRSFTLISSSRPGSGSKSSRLSPRLSSSTSSLNRTKVSETSSAPPLIPPPKSFLQRQASLSSSTSSLASLKELSAYQNQAPSSATPSPPPPPALDSSFHSDSSSLSLMPPPPPPQEYEIKASGDNSFTSTSSSSTEVPSPASSRSSKSTISSSSAPETFTQVQAILTPPSSPPPYPPSPPLSPGLPNTISDAASAVSTSSAHLRVPHDDDARKNSMSPSEVLGLFDLALEDHALSVSTFSDTPYDASADAFSPKFKFSSLSDDLTISNDFARYESQHLPDPFSPGGNNSNTTSANIHESEQVSFHTEAKLHRSSQGHQESTDPHTVNHETYTRSDLDGENERLRRHSVSDRIPHVEISELSPTSTEIRRKRPQSFVVTKLRPDVKTVRQQIKPGTVEDLASLFANMKHQYVTSPTKEKEEMNFNIKEKIAGIKSYEQGSEGGSQPTSPRDMALNSQDSPRGQSLSSSSSSSIDARSKDLQHENIARKLSISSCSEESEHEEQKLEHVTQQLELERKLSVSSSSSSEHSLHEEPPIHHLEQSLQLERKLSVSSSSSSEHSLQEEHKFKHVLHTPEHVENTLSNVEKHFERKYSISSDSSSEIDKHNGVDLQHLQQEHERAEQNMERKLSVSSSSSSEHSIHEEHSLKSVEQNQELERKVSVSSSSSSEDIEHVEQMLEHVEQEFEQETLEKKKSVTSSLSSEISFQKELTSEHLEINLELERKLSVSSSSSSEHNLHEEHKPEHEEHHLPEHVDHKHEHLQLEYEYIEKTSERKLSISSSSSSEHEEHKPEHVEQNIELQRKLSVSSSSSSEHEEHKPEHVEQNIELQRKLSVSSSSSSEHEEHKPEHVEQNIELQRKLSVSSSSSSEHSLHREINLEYAEHTDNYVMNYIENVQHIIQRTEPVSASSFSEHDLHEDHKLEQIKYEQNEERSFERKLSVRSSSSSEHSLHEENILKQLEQNLELERKHSASSSSSSEHSLHEDHTLKQLEQNLELERKLSASSSSSSEHSLHEDHTLKQLEQNLELERKLSVSSSSSSEHSLHEDHTLKQLEQNLELERKLSASSSSSSEHSLHQKPKHDHAKLILEVERKHSVSSSSSSEDGFHEVTKDQLKSPLHPSKSHDSMPALNIEYSTPGHTGGLTSFNSDSNLLSSSGYLDAKPTAAFDFLTASREIMKQINSLGSSRNNSLNRKEKPDIRSNRDATEEKQLNVQLHNKSDVGIDTSLSKSELAALTTPVEKVISTLATSSKGESGYAEDETNSLYVNIDPVRGLNEAHSTRQSQHTVDTHGAGEDGREVILDLPVNHLGKGAIFRQSLLHEGEEKEEKHTQKAIFLHPHKSAEIRQNEQYTKDTERHVAGADKHSEYIYQNTETFIQPEQSVITAVTYSNNAHSNTLLITERSVGSPQDNTAYENIELGSISPSHFDVERSEIRGSALKSGTEGRDSSPELERKHSLLSRSDSSSSSSTDSETPRVVSDYVNEKTIEPTDGQSGQEYYNATFIDTYHSDQSVAAMTLDKKAGESSKLEPDNVVASILSALNFDKEEDDSSSSSSSSSSSDESESKKEHRRHGGVPHEKKTSSQVAGPTTSAQVVVTSVTPPPPPPLPPPLPPPPPRGDGLPAGEGEEIQAGLFAHEMSRLHDETRGWRGAEGRGSDGEVTRDETVTSTSRAVDLSSVSHPALRELTSTVSATDSHSVDVSLHSERPSSANQKDDFLSILNDIEINKDLTSDLGVQDNSAVFSKDKKSNNDSDSDRKEDSDSDSSDTDSNSSVNKKSSKTYSISDHTENHPDIQSGEISAKSISSHFELVSKDQDRSSLSSSRSDHEPVTLRPRKSDLDEAIRKEHRQLSSRIDDYDITFKDSVSTHGSVSSRTSVRPAKETAFNVSFFNQTQSPSLVKKVVDQPSKPPTPTSVAETGSDHGPVLWSSHDQVSTFLNNPDSEKKKAKSSSSSSSSSKSSKNERPLIKNVREEVKRISTSSSSAPPSPHKQSSVREKTNQEDRINIIRKDSHIHSASEFTHDDTSAAPARASIFRHRSLTRSRSSSKSSERDSTPTKVIDEAESLPKDRFQALKRAFENRDKEEKITSFRGSVKSVEHKPVIRGNSWSKHESGRETGHKLNGQGSVESRETQKLLPDLFKGYTGGRTSFPNYFAGEVESSRADPYHLNTATNYNDEGPASTFGDSFSLNSKTAAESESDSQSDSDTSASSKDDSQENLKRKLSGQRNKQIHYSYDLQTGEAKRESLTKKISTKSNSSIDSTTKPHFDDVFLPSRQHDDSTSSSESDDEASHVKKDTRHPDRDTVKHSDSGNKMTAVVGEVSSFGIHKRVTTQEETFSLPSNLSQPLSTHTSDHLTAGHVEGNGSDIYLIQDNKGDYYALQELQENEGKEEENDIHAHIIGNHETRSGLDSYPPVSHRSDLIVDSSAIDDDKAREVIESFLDSQTFSVKRMNNSAHTSGSLERDFVSKQDTYDVRGEGWAGWRQASERETERRTTRHETPAEDYSRSSHGALVVHQSGFDEGVNNRSTYITEDHRSAGSFHADSTPQSQQHHSPYSHSSQVYTSPQNASWADHSITGGYVLLSPTSHVQQQLPPLIVNANQGHAVVSPYGTTPITVTTTTQAVVGEKVDMKIDFSPPVRVTEDHRIMAPPETLSYPQSEFDADGKQYVVRSVPNKSSLKKTSQFDTGHNDLNLSDIVYTKSDTVTADVRLGGHNREIVLKPYEHTTEHYPLTYSTQDTIAPASHNGTLYRVNTQHGGSSRAHDNEPVTSPRHANRSHPSTHDSYYRVASSSSPTREPSDVYRVRNLSASVPESLYVTTTDARGRRDNRNNSFADNDKSYRIIGGSQKHHSPERYFKNAKLSLRKDEYDGRKSDSDGEETKRYRTVTKVYVNGDRTRSRSPSPPVTKYKVSNLQTQGSFDKKVEDKASAHQPLYVVNAKAASRQRKKSGSSSEDDSESDFKKSQKRYRVLGTSDSALNFIGNRTFSTPSTSSAHNRSFDEANIVTTRTVNPSRLQSVPPTTNTHRTIIQLEVDRDKKIKEKQKVEADFVDSRYVVRQTATEAEPPRSQTLYKVTNAPSPVESQLWRTGRAKSMDTLRHIADEEDFPTTRVKSFQQKDGNRMYVVNSTLSDPRGWYKSTIDINENYPDQRNKNAYKEDVYRSRETVSKDRADNYVTERTVYYANERSPSSKPPYRSSYSTEFISPDSGQGTEVASSDGENEASRHRSDRFERTYEVRAEPEIPEHLKSTESLSNDLRVLRGKILIQNRLDGSEHTDDDFDENANLFDTSFHLGKDNPLYSSDPDIMASLQREEQGDMSRHVNQDITFETVDRIAHKLRGASGEVCTGRLCRKVVLEGCVGRLRRKVVLEGCAGRLCWKVVLEGCTGKLHWKVVQEGCVEGCAGRLCWNVVLEGCTGRLRRKVVLEGCTGRLCREVVLEGCAGRLCRKVVLEVTVAWETGEGNGEEGDTESPIETFRDTDMDIGTAGLSASPQKKRHSCIFLALVVSECLRCVAITHPAPYHRSSPLHMTRHLDNQTEQN